MSQVPRAAARAVAASQQAAHIPFICVSKPSMTQLSEMNLGYIPLAQRTSDELRANAVELRNMAATATTPDVVRALLTLADRYAALAESRGAVEGC